jgi:CheY-like chemotaxis protein
MTVADVKRVLLIDDDDSLRSSIERLLTESGHHVVQAADGHAAVQVANHVEEDFDVVLCDYDLGLNSPNGFDVVTQLQAMRPGSFLEPTRFYIVSGLQRDVPKGCGFILKDRFENILKAVEG